MDYGEIAENAEFAEQKRRKAPRNASLSCYGLSVSMSLIGKSQ